MKNITCYFIFSRKCGEMKYNDSVMFLQAFVQDRKTLTVL